MTARVDIAWALLAAGGVLQLLALLGVLLLTDALDRLHYLAASSPAAILIAAAIFVREGPSLITIRALLLMAVLVVTGPVLAHVTARAIHLARNEERK